MTSIFDHGPTSHHLATLLSFALEMPSIPRVIVCEPDVKCARYSTALYTVRITCIRKEDPKSHSGLCDRPHNCLCCECKRGRYSYIHTFSLACNDLSHHANLYVHLLDAHTSTFHCSLQVEVEVEVVKKTTKPVVGLSVNGGPVVYIRFRLSD